MRMRTTVLLIVMTALGCASIPPAAEGPGPVTQLTANPGKWEFRRGPMPPLAEIIAQAPAPRPVYGLYTWCGEYSKYRDSIRKVGWRCVRIAGPMDDATMAMLAADDIEVMMTVGVHATGEKRNRPDYDSDEAFVAESAARQEAADNEITR